MKNIFTAEEMRKADSLTIRDIGIPGIVLMENAGAGIVCAMEKKIDNLKRKKVLVVCGKGNNGGDGFVIARLLLLKGFHVQVVLLGEIKDLAGDARTNAEVARNMKVPLYETGKGNSRELSHAMRHTQIVVDAVFGTGLTRKVEGPAAKVIRQLNTLGKFTVAVDIPSGIDSDTGQLSGPHIQANLTLALGAYKRSHFLFPAAEAMGQLELIDIGIPHSVMDGFEESVSLLEAQDILACFPERKRNSHKGTYGHLLILAGSKGKGGAAGLTALSGLHSGAGLVTLGCPESMIPSQEWHPMEVMSLPLPETGTGAMAEKAAEPTLEALKGKNALAIGPGLGTSPSTLKYLEALLPGISCPMVIDADGLNLLGKKKSLLNQLPKGTILTPHPKEMSRLTGLSTPVIQKNRLKTVQDFCTQFKVILVLKGAHSLIGLPDGRIRINPTGNAGMATGGSGDVLTGLIGGFLAQGLPPEKAALAGVYLHGLSGDIYTRQLSERSLIAGDLIDHLPTAIKEALG
ncbi:MAG: NAD(P)H-hydrate dehydratase [Candidatus Nitronauta litoralis]|uniref:Bifunctional NAD(P)H-hydrate repair enzyme n=1 Tax=Candidatus Nitronauta litoralis TaxID=2705533 RepID=A0A7T0BZ32_9BACT|nr:MAG: NAD(P)H-hydrate dehydratase [Candidatus Nitronauta litoralis]